MKHTKFALLAALVLGTASLAACGNDDEDPAPEDTGMTEDTGSTEDVEDDTDEDTGMTEDVDEDVDEDTGSDDDVIEDAGSDDDVIEDTGSDDDVIEDTGSDDDVIEDTGSDDDVIEDTGSGDDVTEDTGPTSCGEGVTYVGQVFSPAEQGISPNGGNPVFTSPYGDSGLQELFDALPEATEDDESTADTVENVASVEIALTNATVIATAANSEGAPTRSGRIMYLADEAGVFKVFLYADATEMHATFPIIVGQQISLTVTEVTNYNGLPEISGVEAGSWALGSEGNDVYINDVDGPITMDHFTHLVRVTGTLGAEGTGCGGDSVCYDMTYAGSDDPITFRTNAPFVTGGECVTFVGIVDSFGGSAQLNTENWDWIFVYE